MNKPKAEGELVTCWTIDGRLLVFYNHYTDPLKGGLVYGSLRMGGSATDTRGTADPATKTQGTKVDEKGQYYLW